MICIRTLDPRGLARRQTHANGSLGLPVDFISSLSHIEGTVCVLADCQFPISTSSPINAIHIIIIDCKILHRANSCGISYKMLAM